MTRRTSNVGAVMSMPRVGFTETFDCAITALVQCGITLKVGTGAFWGQALEAPMEDMVRKGKEWILTIDYDSVFTIDHLEAMFEIIDNNPQIDALAPVQIKRFKHSSDDNYKVLTSIAGKELAYSEIDKSKATTEVDTAHFGLTLIKVEALLEMPKPWFHSYPGKDGFWEKGTKLDDDIYFWKSFKESGHSLHLANNVIVGHLESFCLAPNPDTGEIDYLSGQEFRTRSKKNAE